MNGTKFFTELRNTFLRNGYELTNFSKKNTDYGVWTTRAEYKLNTKPVTLTLIETYDGYTNTETVKVEEVGNAPEIIIYHEES